LNFSFMTFICYVVIYKCTIPFTNILLEWLLRNESFAKDTGYVPFEYLEKHIFPLRNHDISQKLLTRKAYSWMVLNTFRLKSKRKKNYSVEVNLSAWSTHSINMPIVIFCNIQSLATECYMNKFFLVIF